jgi:glutamyl-tRNA reductase
MQRRKSRPLFMIDIAMPRDLDPAIAAVDNVFLYNIDDLEGIVGSNLEQRRKESAKIEAMIAIELEAFRSWYKTLGVIPLIRALQTKAETIHAETMESLEKKLPDLDERELKVIRKLTKSIVNQMMSDPILRIKEMAGEKQAGEAMDMFVKLFALEQSIENGRESAQAASKSSQATEPQAAVDSAPVPMPAGLAAVTP